LSYKNISLGQMAENHFGYIFIETIRSIALSKRILSRERPNIIYLPPKMGDGLCYRMLPVAIKRIALNIPIVILESSMKATLSRKMDNLINKVGFILYGVSYVINKCLHNIPILLKSKGKNIILFVYVSTYQRIYDEMDKSKNACIEIFFPSLPSISRLGRSKIKDLRSLEKEFVQTKVANFYYDGVSLKGILWDEFQQFFTVKAPSSVGDIEWAERIVKVLKPKVMVVFEDATTLSRTYCRTFKNNGVPVIAIQHGVPMNRIGVGLYDFLICPLEATVQAVWGEIGINGKQGGVGVVTGNPQYDFVYDGFYPDKLKTCHNLSLDPDKGIIVVATEWYNGYTVTPTDEAGERFIRYTLRALKGFTDKQIVIKLHPTFNKEYGKIAKAIAEEENIEATITATYLWELFGICDLVVVTTSTVGLDAMILGTPVVVVNIEEHPDIIAYVPRAATGAYKPEAIALVVREVLDNDDLRRGLDVGRGRFIHDYAYNQDGKASYRVAELISEMIKKEVKNV
jgi:glycosyltransferase involved in cell wall biosynthesis